MNLEKLPQLPQDKANHFIYGALASVAGVVVASAIGMPPATLALLFSAGVGIAKELWDKTTGLGDPDILDALATAAGGLPAALALWAVA